MTEEIDSFEKYEFPGMEPVMGYPLSPEVQRIYGSAGKNTPFCIKSRGTKDLGWFRFLDSMNWCLNSETKWNHS